MPYRRFTSEKVRRPSQLSSPRWGAAVGHSHRGTSLIRNSTPLGPYSRTMLKSLW